MSTYLGKYCIIGLPVVWVVFKLRQQNEHLSGKLLYSGFTYCVSGVLVKQQNEHLSGNVLYSWFTCCVIGVFS